MPSIRVELGENSYPIIVDQGVLNQLGSLLKPKAKSEKTLIVVDAIVSKHYSRPVLESLLRAGFDSRIVEIPVGEEHKSLEWFAKLHDQLIDRRMDRSSTLIALGGGVIGDLAGFVAATYMRGIPYVQVPTTLLAQVDASVGGKTAINHPKGKNLIGAFHQPKLVLIDVATLQSLSPRDIRSGLAEIIKHGVIMDVPLFDQIEANLDAILDLEGSVLIDIIARSCADKVKVVTQDEKESGLREILNYGHTFGHALEALTDYNTYRHGEAVAIGMNCAAQLSVNLGMLDAADRKRQKNLLQRAGLPVHFPSEIQPEQLIETMYLDKKARGGRLRLILAKRIGGVMIRNDVDDTTIAEAIAQCMKD
ncbi:MAG: 3-dehydroquinate synthase [Candidatus Poribacteria bacterium]|nr:3-dehydroquinate synthase [Candidatus Poribacteria bacterium]